MENKGMPAFPIVVPEGKYHWFGVTKLEFFACNAPDVIPGWFKHTPPDIKITPKPDWLIIEGKEDQEHVRQWLEDGQELPEWLQWFSEQYKVHDQEYGVFTYANLEAKYFQWRRYYAEQLLKELEK